MPTGRPDTPRNTAEKIIGKEALLALDSLGIGVYSRDLLLAKQRLLLEFSRVVRILAHRNSYRGNTT
jgi:hypothetical protein